MLASPGSIQEDALEQGIFIHESQLPAHSAFSSMLAPFPGNTCCFPCAPPLLLAVLLLFPFHSSGIGPPPVVQTMGARLEPAVGALERTGSFHREAPGLRGKSYNLACWRASRGVPTSTATAAPHPQPFCSVLFLFRRVRSWRKDHLFNQRLSGKTWFPHRSLAAAAAASRRPGLDLWSCSCSAPHLLLGLYFYCRRSDSGFGKFSA